MKFDKDIISRIILALFFIGFVLRVFIPLFFSYIKKKIPGISHEEHDIDYMIKKQSEKIKREQFSNEISSKTSFINQTVSELKKETGWGGGKITKEIQSCIKNKFNYTLSETKIISFIKLNEKKYPFVAALEKKSEIEIINYLSSALILRMIIDEIITKEHLLIHSISKKLKTNTTILVLSIQMKLLSFISSQKNIKDDKLYSSKPILNEFSDETILTAIDHWTTKEGSQWSKDISLLFEELSLYITYAHHLAPLPKMEGPKDLQSAYLVLNINQEISIEDVKKHFKKIAMNNHPDKLANAKLPKFVENKAIEQFQKIKQAYELILESKK